MTPSQLRISRAFSLYQCKVSEIVGAARSSKATEENQHKRNCLENNIAKVKGAADMMQFLHAEIMQGVDEIQKLIKK